MTTMTPQETAQYLDGDPDDLMIDWSDVPAAPAPGEYQPVPPGVYRATIFEVHPDKASTGTPYLAVTVRLTDAPHNGRRLTDKFYLTKAAKPRFRDFLLSLGYPPEYFGSPQPLPREELLDEEVTVTVIHETRDGQVWAKVKRLQGHKGIARAAARPVAADEEILF